MRFFSAVLVTDTSMVRSSRSSPSRTFSSRCTAPCNTKSLASMLWRKRVRVFSIRRALVSSSARVSSGISPICIRYIRTGSSMHSRDPLVNSSISMLTSTSSESSASAASSSNWASLTSTFSSSACSCRSSSACGSTDLVLPRVFFAATGAAVRVRDLVAVLAAFLRVAVLRACLAKGSLLSSRRDIEQAG